MRQQSGRVGHAGTAQAFNVALHRPSHGCKARLCRAFDALLCAFEGDQQRFDAAGDLCLLLRHPHCRLQVDDQVVIPRARQVVYQFFQLTALQSDITEARFCDGQACHRIGHLFLRLACQSARFNGLRCGIATLTCQLFLDAAEFLPQQDAADQCADGHRRGDEKRNFGDAAQRRRGTLRCCGQRGRRLRTHGSDSIDATTSARAGRHSCTLPKPAARAACAMRGWVASARAWSQA